MLGSANNMAIVSQGNAAGRKLLQWQAANLSSAFNLGQLNQAAVQQLAQAGIFGSANNGAIVSQGNILG